MPRAPGVAEPNDEGEAFFSDPAGNRIGLMKAMSGTRLPSWLAVGRMAAGRMLVPPGLEV
jgi:hypothetical protein